MQPFKVHVWAHWCSLQGMGEESQINYWDDSNNFYEALNLAFSDDSEQGQSDIGVKETKTFSSGNRRWGQQIGQWWCKFLLGGRPYGGVANLNFSCWAFVLVSGTKSLCFPATILRSVEIPSVPDSFESIILQIVYLIRTASHTRTSRCHTSGITHLSILVSTVVDFCYGLNSCLHDLDDHF